MMPVSVTISDLGELPGDVLIFGGCYSNLQATEALVAEAAARGIPAANLICTGDVVAYCTDPVATVRVVRASGAVVIAGNVERQIAAEAADCGCGFEAGSVCDRLSSGWYAFAAAACDADVRGWMAGLPDFLIFRHGPRRYAVVHGGATDIARFLWPSSGDDLFLEEFAAIEAIAGPVDGIIAGHSGIAFERVVHGKHWINAGVIGMPPHDGRQMTRFVLLTDRGAMIERLSYDAPGAAEAMVRAGLGQGYHEALITGRWPSEDVLPREMRVVQDFASG